MMTDSIFRRAAVCVTALAFCATAGLAASISSIVVDNRGTGQIDKGFVKAQIDSRVGDSFNPKVVARDVKSLLESGRYSYVGTEAKETAAGIELIYVLHRKFVFSKSLRITGNELLSERDIRDLLNLRPGDPIDDQTLATRVLSVRDEYAKKLLPEVDITWDLKVLNKNTGEAQVILKIDEGKRASLKGIQVKGNSTFTEAELSQLILKRRWWNPFTYKRQPYDQGIVAAGMAAIRQHYMNAGFLDVSVTEPGIIEDKRGRRTLNIEIDEGPQYRFGRIQLRGVTHFPEGEIRQYMPMESGELASVALLEAGKDAVITYYGDRGYINTMVRSTINPVAGSDVADIILDVNEGKLTYVQNIRIRGNSRTKDEVIRRELAIFPGDEYRISKVRLSERRLQNLQFFSKVDSYDEPGDADDRSDLVFEVEETRTGQFMVGAGFSSVDNLIGFVELSQGNFDIGSWPPVGGGQKLKLSGQSGSTRNEFLVSFVEPWFAGRRLRFATDIYKRDRDFDDYDESRTGAKFEFNVPYQNHSRVGLSYTIEDVGIDDVADTNEYMLADGSPYLFDNSTDELQSSVGVSFLYDTRDNTLIPTRGNKTTIGLEMTGGAFGGDTEFYSTEVKTSHYFPLFAGHVLSLRATAKVVEEFGDTDELSLADLLFAGGPRTIRGFEWRDVGPKATRELVPGAVVHRPIGGRTLGVVTAEYTIPLNDAFRFATFVDAGNVWEEAYDFELSEYAASYGFGLRLDIPGFPIRLDYAWDLETDDEFTDTDRWSFSIRYE